MNNDKLKYNIKTNQNNKENILDLQLFSSVSNPYTFTLDGDYNISATIESNLVDLSYYANDIPNFSTITEIPQENLDYLQSGLCATDMYGMFMGCKQLVSIPKLNIDASQCKNMYYMFRDCSSLTSIDLSNLRPSDKLKNITSMFYKCTKLEFANLSNFNTTSITDLYQIFYYCSSLISVNLTGWDTSNVTRFNRMFMGCENLETIEGIIDMKNCELCYQMFYGCSKLKGVKIKNPPSYLSTSGMIDSSQYEIVS